MRLGLNIGYWGAGMGPALDLVKEAERLGYDTVWAAEAYGADAVTVLTWIAARTETHPRWVGHPPDARPHTGDDGDDGGNPR